MECIGRLIEPRHRGEVLRSPPFFLLLLLSRSPETALWRALISARVEMTIWTISLTVLVTGLTSTGEHRHDRDQSTPGGSLLSAKAS